MKKLCILSGLALVSVLGFSSLIDSSVNAQVRQASCTSFTGVYSAAGTGVVVHIGDNKLIVYNGSARPLIGRCIGGGEFEVTFEDGRLRKARKSGDNIEWYTDNNFIWNKVESTVTFPLDVF
jgi:hypothetical protein